MIRSTFILLAALVAGAPPSGAAQSTSSPAAPEIALPGGATGATVACLQAGSLAGSVLVATFLQKDGGDWEQRSDTGTFAFAETKRDELVIELVDKARKKLVQLDFVTHTIREKDGAAAAWSDRYVILSATDATTSQDCISAATPHRAGKPIRSRMAIVEDRNWQRLWCVAADGSPSVQVVPRATLVDRLGTPMNILAASQAARGFLSDWSDTNGEIG